MAPQSDSPLAKYSKMPSSSTQFKRSGLADWGDSSSKRCKSHFERDPSTNLELSSLLVIVSYDGCEDSEVALFRLTEIGDEEADSAESFVDSISFEALVRIINDDRPSSFPDVQNNCLVYTHLQPTNNLIRVKNLRALKATVMNFIRGSAADNQIHLHLHIKTPNIPTSPERVHTDETTTASFHETGSFNELSDVEKEGEEDDQNNYDHKSPSPPSSSEAEVESISSSSSSDSEPASDDDDDDSHVDDDYNPAATDKEDSDSDEQDVVSPVRRRRIIMQNNSTPRQTRTPSVICLDDEQLPIRQGPNTHSEVITDDELYCQASDDEEEQWDMSDDEKDTLAKHTSEGDAADDEGPSEDSEIDLVQKRMSSSTIRCEKLLDEDLFSAVQSFYLLPNRHGNDGKHPRRKHKIRGLKVSLFIHQMFAVFWQLKQNVDMSTGGIIGDEMGLGKTRQAILYHLISAWIGRIVQHVDKYPAKHLNPNDDQPLDPLPKCPSQHFFPILCTCVRYGETASLIRKNLGPTLTIVATAQLNTWINEWAECVDFDQNGQNVVGLRLYVAHRSATQKRFVNLNNPTIHILANESAYFKLKEANPDPKYYPCMILTTPGSYNTHVANRIVSQPPLEYTLPWGTIFRDEFHQEKQKNGSFAICWQTKQQQENTDTTCRFWLLSGTPCDRGPLDIQYWVRLLEASNWCNRTGLRIGCSETFQRFVSKVKSLERAKLSQSASFSLNEFDRCAVKFGSFMEELMIRRTANTDWYGKCLVKLPPSTHKDISCPLPPRYIADIANREKKQEDKAEATYRNALARYHQNPSLNKVKPRFTAQNFFEKSRLNRILAIFPGLLNILADSPHLTFTMAEIKEHKTMLPMIFNRIDEIVRESSKCEEIEKILAELKSKRDFQGRKEKVVILTSFPIAVQILAYWLQHRLEYNVGVISSMITSNQRDDIINAFETDQPYRMTPKDKDKLPSPDILVGTVELTSRGYTCVRARTLILLGPEWLEGYEDQAYGRIRRIGQKNDETFTYRLICPDIKVENAILNRQVLRAEFLKKSLEIEQEVEKQVVGRSFDYA
ncbi:hypothetical protein AJ79_01436 [Helicocarpus griseus UAMH5409]|uniref:Helicase C-terminal domain-containing protein n=1 Tax=Helicocarpus griseus UAMH5409 TaxID=1447875 RepID=A0A2B7Y846_9EURO|nr:hypothetical protein AJ79_01436 [Helicocarpus griseus UAMH5409]